MIPLGVDLIYGLNDGDLGLVKMNEMYYGRVDESLFAIADAGAGDQFFWSSDSNAVFFWHHESAHGEASKKAMTKVSESIEDFLNGMVNIVRDDDLAEGKVSPGAFKFLLDK